MTVSLRRSDHGQVRLCVRDNGKGLPAGFHWREAPSLGLRLFQMLAEQLHAVVEVAGNGGAQFTVVFEGLNG